MIHEDGRAVMALPFFIVETTFEPQSSAFVTGVDCRTIVYP